jgi:hypothetical protein
LARWTGAVGCALVLGLLSIAPAQAGVCAVGDECDITLDSTNVVGVSITINVHIDNTGATTVLTVTWLGDNLQNTPIGIDQFGYNSNALATSLSGSWSQADCNPPGQDSCNMDGFGRMLSEIDDPGGNDITFNFTLDALVTNFAENKQGAEFIAHIRYSDGCSGFVSDGKSKSPEPSTSCLIEEIPEPATLLLVVAGLLGIAAAQRKRLAS